MVTWPKIPHVFKYDTKGNMCFGVFSSPNISYLADNKWIWTEKIDGTNIRIIWDGYNLTYKGRKEKSEIPEFLLSRLKEIFEPRKHLIEQMFGNKTAILFGEGYGNRINKNRYKLDSVEWIMFGAWVNGVFVDSPETIADELNLPMVPLYGIYTLNEIITSFQENPEKESLLFDNIISEGLVGVPATYPLLHTKEGNPIMVKIITENFIKLNKNGE